MFNLKSRLLKFLNIAQVPLFCMSQSKIRGPVWVVLLWFFLIVPGIFIRGSHHDEGYTIGLARGAFEDGHWLTPHLYGLRFVERPVLASWMIGGLGLLFGRVDLWMGRLPAVLSLLGGALLIYVLVRQYTDKRGALFGAISFLVSPMMLHRLITAETDIVVSVLMFAAFVVWWKGHENGSIGAGRWVSLAGILTAAAYVKGPQPLGFFFLGVGAYLLVYRRWQEFLQLVLLGIVPAAAVALWYLAVYQHGDFLTWKIQTRLQTSVFTTPLPGHWRCQSLEFTIRLLLESLPGILLAAPLVALIRHNLFTGNRKLALALLFYASSATILLIFWPGAKPRYAMSFVLGISAVAGLLLGYFRIRFPTLAAFAQCLSVLLVVYALVISLIVMPIRPSLFEGMRGAGTMIAKGIPEHVKTLYVVPDWESGAAFKALIYVPGHISLASIDALPHTGQLYYLMASAEQLETILQNRPDLQLREILATGSGLRLLLVNDSLPLPSY
jgi:4-amino-4-deoxy-L-arabinose transferase-like glycosyltransferase